MILLLNVLIAVLNNRYEKARKNAKSMWKCKILKVMRALEHCVLPAKVLKQYFIPNDGNGSLFFSEKLKRWYLLLMLPADVRELK